VVLGVDDKLALLAEVQKQKAELRAVLDRVKDQDRYWFYEPSDGSLTPEAAAFAEKWLKPEDRPQKWYGVKDAMASGKKIVGLFGGNRAGKTIALVILSCAKVIGRVPKSLEGVVPEHKLPKKWPVYGRVYGLSSSVIEEVLIPKFKEWMPKEYWHSGGWDHTYNKQEKILRFYKNGREFVGHIKFISCEQEVEKTQGVDLSFAHFDEEPPHNFYEEALSRFGTTKMDIGFFLTPTNGISWLYDTLINNGDENIETFKVSTLTNKHISIDSLETIMQQLDSYESRKMRLLGEFVSLSGLIYSGDCQFYKDIHVIKPFELEWDNHIVYRGIDIHTSKETCCVEVAVLPNNTKVVVGVYWKKADAETVKRDLAARAVERKYRLGWTRYDKSLDYEQTILGGMNIIDLLKRSPNAIPAMFPSDKHKGSIDAGIDLIKRDLKLDQHTKKPKVYFFDTPEVWLLIKDIQTLERDRAANEEKKGTRDKINEGKKDRHAAFRYVYQGNPRFIAIDDTVDEEVPEERYI